MAEKWEYEIRHNSSVDQIERAMKFYRALTDFLELIDLHDEGENLNTARSAVKFLQSKAMAIASNEADTA